MSLVEKQNWLSYSTADLLAECANKLRVKKFAKDFWPLVKKYVTKSLDSLYPEWFYFAVQIMENHSVSWNFWKFRWILVVSQKSKFSLLHLGDHLLQDTLKAEVSFLSSGGELCISDEDCDRIVNILKVSVGYYFHILQLCFSMDNVNHNRRWMIIHLRSFVSLSGALLTECKNS